MKANVDKKIRGLTREELTAEKAEYQELLQAEPTNAEAKEIIALIDELLAAPPTPTPKNRAVKVNMVKVRATGQPVHINGQHITSNPKESFEVPESELERHGSLLKRVAAVAVLLFLFAFTSSAQLYQTPSLALTNGATGTNAVMNGVNTNCSFVSGGGLTNNQPITVTKYQELNLFLGSAACAASTSNVVWQIDSGPDTNHWAALQTVTYADTGTTFAGTNVTVYVGSAGYVRIRNVTSPTSIVAHTNVTAIPQLKPNRFGGG